MAAARARPRAPREAFLSHASADRALAGALATTLRAHGVKIWYSTTSIRGAQQWHDAIGRALRRCDWFLLLLSPSAVRSRWVKQELLFALNKSQYAERIIPLLAKRCDTDALSWTLDALQHIDLRRRYEPGCRELLRIWGLRYDGRRATIPRRGRSASGRKRKR